jgi:hypothetical protein
MDDAIVRIRDPQSELTTSQRSAAEAAIAALGRVAQNSAVRTYFGSSRNERDPWKPTEW